MRRDEKARSRWPRVLGYFLAAMALLTLLSRAADSIMLPVVKCARPFPGALRHTVALSGAIEAREQWPVMAEEELAVARVYVRAGQSVKAGEALLSYDAEALQRKLDEKQVEVKKLTWEAQLEALKQAEQPAASPSGQPTPTPTPAPDAGGDKGSQEKKELEQRISRLAIDKAQREVDQLSQLLYGGAVLVAPVDGLIGEVIVKPGEKAAGAALRFSPTSSGLVVRCEVTEDQAKHLKPGMEARFQRSGDARASQEVAVLKGISPTKTGYEASFDLPDGAGAIGQAVSITATQDTQTYSMRVARGAIVENGGVKGVYRIRMGQSVLGDMEYAEFVPVEVIEADWEHAAISASLSDQDQVIVSKSKPLNPGDRVRSSS